MFIFCYFYDNFNNLKTFGRTTINIHVVYTFRRNTLHVMRATIKKLNCSITQQTLYPKQILLCSAIKHVYRYLLSAIKHFTRRIRLFIGP